MFQLQIQLDYSVRQMENDSFDKGKVQNPIK
jgi:hypothetical protein